MRRFFVLLSVVVVILETGRALACTALCISNKKQIVVAKSYDFHVGHGLLVENRRGVIKEAAIPGEGKPLRWESRYASLTFNQYGREFPLGGMNEKGLVIEILWLNETLHPPLKPNRDTINELQFIQYLLDRTANLKEAIREIRRIQISKVYGDVHYFMCDRGGACATVAHLNGKLVIHAGNRLPVRAITNNTYADSIRHRTKWLKTIRKKSKRGDHDGLPQDTGSLSRFLRAAHAASRKYPPKTDLVAEAFAVLDSVLMGDYSKWQIVYEPRLGRVHFRRPGDKKSSVVTLSAQNCNVPVRAMDLLGSVGGTTGSLGPYTPELNNRLVKRSFERLGVKLPQAMIRDVKRYPARTICKVGEKNKTSRETSEPEPDPRIPAVLAVLDGYKTAMNERNAAALGALIHPDYGEPGEKVSADYATGRSDFVRRAEGMFRGLKSISVAMKDPKVVFKGENEAVVDVFVSTVFTLKSGRPQRLSNTTRFVLRRSKGRWLFVSGL